MASFGPGATTLAVVNQVYEVKLVSHCSGQLGLNVRYYRSRLQTGSGTTLGTIATLMNSVFADLYKACLSSAADWIGVAVRIIKPLPASAAAFNKEDTGAGSRTGDVLPRQTAGIVTLQSMLGGRKYRGRAYIPFPAESDNTSEGVPAAGYRTNIQALGDAMVTDRIAGTPGVNDLTLTPCLYHRASNDTTDLFTAQERDRWASQRRRGDYGAGNAIPF